jgi:iron complex transport system substrate-binding protein
MSIERIVSFFPSATELLYELGVGDKIYGVTHECLYPKDANTKPRVINSVFDPSEMSSKEIDDKIVQLMKDGKNIYKLDEDNLKKARPDLIISQETCEVCSAHTDHVNKALSILEKKPIVHPLDPHDLEEMFNDVKHISKLVNKEKEGDVLVESLKKRISIIKNNKFDFIPRVLAIEWLEPFFTSGHWIPEMIEIAGGKNEISTNKQPSRRLSFDEVENCDPDVIILMPCGFDLNRTVSEYNKILQPNQAWKNLRAVKQNNIFAVDANSYFSKPSIRTITGIEILAKILHPESFEKIRVPPNSFLQIA